jgi:hypothetical protein
MKKIIIFLFIICLSTPAFSQTWLIGSWYADTGSEYDVRLIFKKGGKGLMELRDLEIDETIKSNCKSWKFKWTYIDNGIRLSGLPWSCTFKMNINKGHLEPASEEQCGEFLSKPYFKSTNAEYGKELVGRWKIHKCK